MTHKTLLQRLALKLRDIPEVKLAYFFGSRARGDFGLASDYDFAFYTDERDSKKLFTIECLIGNILAQELKHDQFDIVMLDRLDSPELAYQILQEGKLFLDREPYRIIFEPQVINKYEDYMIMLRRNHLTIA